MAACFQVEREKVFLTKTLRMERYYRAKNYQVPAALMIMLLWVLPLTAQRDAGAVGIGAQFGDPTGVTVKVYNPDGLGLDFMAAWDLDDFFFLNVHGLVERHIGQSERLHWFVGPGVFAGFRDEGDAEDVVNDGFALGISGTAGLSYFFGNAIEVFGQVTPRLELVDETDGSLGGGIGIRFYLR